MPSNYSILERNLLDSLTECGQVAFMWARERTFNDRYAYKAEKFARNVEYINDALGELLGISINRNMYDEIGDGFDIMTAHDLKNFILKRHSSNVFKGEKSGWTDREDIYVSLQKNFS